MIVAAHLDRNDDRLMPGRALLMADVPCDGCTLCCSGAGAGAHRGVFITPAEEGKYEIERRFGRIMIARRENGDCIYLEERGCAVHDDKPLMCQGFDCRALLKKHGWHEMKRGYGKKIARRARDLIASARSGAKNPSRP